MLKSKFFGPGWIASSKEVRTQVRHRARNPSPRRWRRPRRPRSLRRFRGRRSGPRGRRPGCRWRWSVHASSSVLPTAQSVSPWASTPVAVRQRVAAVVASSLMVTVHPCWWFWRRLDAPRKLSRSRYRARRRSSAVASPKIVKAVAMESDHGGEHQRHVAIAERVVDQPPDPRRAAEPFGEHGRQERAGRRHPQAGEEERQREGDARLDRSCHQLAPAT
jgi:hypothetical protein